MSILIVDDDATVLDVVRRYLTADGHDVLLAEDGERALELFAGGGVELAILDVMLPRLGGLEVARTIRASSDIPIIMLTAMGDEADRVLGLRIGADDYVVKPFSPRELSLRVASILRRSGPLADAATTGASQVRADGDLVVDLGARIARRAGRDLQLTTRELDLLAFLMAHPGQAFSRAELLERVWEWTFGDQSTVTVHVRRLREKIEVDPASPERIRTVWGVGYRYDVQSLLPSPKESP